MYVRDLPFLCLPPGFAIYAIICTFPECCFALGVCFQINALKTIFKSESVMRICKCEIKENFTL